MAETRGLFQLERHLFPKGIVMFSALFEAKQGAIPVQHRITEIIELDI